MMASLILEIGPSMLYRDPFCPGTLPLATGCFLQCWVRVRVRVFPEPHPLPCAGRSWKLNGKVRGLWGL